jgi:hypothetical protein
MPKMIIVNYYDSSATRIVRSREYPTIRHARRAMARAAKRHGIAVLAGDAKRHVIAALRAF